MSGGRDDRDELLERYLEIRDPFLPPIAGEMLPLLEGELHAQTEDLRRAPLEPTVTIPLSEWERLCDLAAAAAKTELELRRVRRLLAEVMRALER